MSKYGDRMRRERALSSVLICVFLVVASVNIIRIYPAATPVVVALLTLMVLCFVLWRKWKKSVHIRKMRTIRAASDLQRKYKQRPQDFERFVAELYEYFGYHTEVTPAARDAGKDVIMTKGLKRYVVEVKLYGSNNKITRPQVQKLHAAMHDTKSHGAIFVTTSSFSRDAIAYAERNGIELVDGLQLVELIQKQSEGK